ncbi:Retinoic acid early transcript 1G protein [Myotis brandtii]|uniref:Retinoic acid early transcript 1G protein n=1 Tax=Myotis brandtii TaxID=109478 RepID=S7PYN7_MYOBR|nr:Retinoic acid early transcript 1G protein [Myotis brandtii]
MNATQAWNQQRDALNYVMEELKKILLDIKAERIATSDPLSLQGGMLCKQESSGCTSASWEFALDGQISLHFDSKNGNWTVLHDEVLSTKAASTTATALSTASKRITSLLPVILTCWVIAGIVGWSLYSNRLPMLPRRP